VPYVLRCFGLTWDDLEAMHRDGVLPLEQILWLLDIVQHEEMRLAALGQRPRESVW
jgi:hypothetical protein